ncbi:MAG: hypothetical protein SLAVMIC_00554 [uncultured marine phage]|uniref:Uncharacterized protein n=1 Tax=uncultured marine phage TaxID=707152 RepID=A0A8D9FQB4_9VIRU|nr:MAG: hypothetical protein SLAVMIC_00554 [uncultured marine phage]
MIITLSILFLIVITSFITVPLYKKRKLKRIEEEFQKEKLEEEERECHLKVIRIEKEFKEKYRYLMDLFKNRCVQNHWYCLFDGDEPLCKYGFDANPKDSFYYHNGRKIPLNFSDEEIKQIEDLEGRLHKLVRISESFRYRQKDIYAAYSYRKMLMGDQMKGFEEELKGYYREKRFEKLLDN